MKIEIKNISLKSIVLSAFPLLVFTACLLTSIIPVAGASELSLLESILAIVLNALVETVVFLALFIAAAFIYNLFCSFGIKGLAFTLEEPASNEDNKEETK